MPATSANLGPGYDVLGAALAIELELEVVECGEFSVDCDGFEAPRDRDNLVVRAFERLHPADGIAFRIGGAIPLGRGLGSSAAATVAGLMAADHLFELAHSKQDILAIAGEMEGHLDNAAAAIYGGFSLVGPADAGPVRIEPPEGIEGVLVMPSEPVSTNGARAAMPTEVPLCDAIHNIAASGRLVLGLERSDPDLIASGLGDRLHQPHRASLFPKSIELVERARGLGALGATISGAGPTVLIWTHWQSSTDLLDALRAEAEGWADVERVQFSPRGARVEL